MSKRRMTPEQARAVEKLEGDVAIKAGAGSGKTTVLSHRFAQAAKRGTVSGSEVDRLLTITFTNKAAAELAQRVHRVLAAELSMDAARQIDGAWISTIHSFCGRVLRRHLLESGVEPFFGQADEVTAAAMKAEAFEAAASRVLLEDPNLLALVEGMSLETLRTRVMACHDKARALGLDPAAAIVDVDPAALVRLVEQISAKTRALRVVLEDAKATPSVVAALEQLDTWSAALAACSLDEPRSCDDLVRIADDYSLTAPSGAGAREANNDVKAARDALRALAKALQQEQALQALQALVREYASVFAESKRQRGLLDFDDLQERAVQLLETDERIAGQYREHFDLIMVDEFQDTNDLQLRVLAPLRNNNLCVVGDERQSIYGFRYANVDIFRRMADSMETPIALSDNFRSHAGVLGFVNGLFSQPHMFGPEFMQLHARREGGWVDPELDGSPRVECVFVDKAGGEAAHRAEAEWIARRITALVREGARPGSIAVLLRAATRASVYADAIEATGTPVLLTAGADLLATYEAVDVMALLRAIAVPSDDEALHAVLTGPLVSASDDALLAIRRAAGKRSLWEGLESVATAAASDSGCSHHDAAVLTRAYRKLDELGALQGHVSLSELIRLACEAFDYDLTLYACGPKGERSWANVLKITEFADGFERAESSDPAQFVEYLKLRGIAGKDKPAPADASSEAVRIMTIHAAKGLEFPIVFAPGLSAGKKPPASHIVVDAADIDGVVVPLIGVKLPTKTFGEAANGAFIEMAAKQTQSAIEEEQRCLYVACTRAEELLVLSGCTALDKEPEQGGSLIDWVRQGLSEVENGLTILGGVPVRVTEVLPEEQAPGESDSQDYEWDAPVVAGDDAEAADEERILGVPQSVSYSALHLYELCPLSFHARYRLRLGALRDLDKSRATQFGSAVHAALQAGARGQLDRARIDAIVRHYGLTEAESVRLTAASDSFLQSALAREAFASERFATEDPLLVSLTDTRLLGSIDLIAWNGPDALIVDYKTGRAPEGDEERARSYELQAQCYALAALESGAERARVRFAFVEHDGVFEEYEYDRRNLPELRERIEGIVSLIAGEVAPAHLASYRRGVCDSCPAVSGLCPIRLPA
ncbi:MAG TPA: UvrD-helicase domain-containing protein [Coriobacteriia bacterium]|nr:UvrD-helicase domain-containing protein [Coriobacteriia bacterium]